MVAKMDRCRYIIITAVRDEAKYVERTIESVLAQTVKPAEWALVNDGSTDRTGEIIRRYADRYAWIKPITRENRGYRKPGQGVVEAFYEGFSSLSTRDYNYIVKLDGDLIFPECYFEKCFERFAQNGSLGIGGGIVYSIVNGNKTLEKNPIFHVRGATKIYRRECWETIGGIERLTGWDTIDEVKANMHGWKTMTFPELEVIQLRRTGSMNGSFNNMVKNGRANYISHYHPLFVIIKAFRRAFKKPFLMESIAILYGYVGAAIKRENRIDDINFRNYIRNQQLRKITFRSSIWQ